MAVGGRMTGSTVEEKLGCDEANAAELFFQFFQLKCSSPKISPVMRSDWILHRFAIMSFLILAFCASFSTYECAKQIVR